MANSHDNKHSCARKVVMTESTSFPLFESNPSTLLTIIGGISSCLFLFYRWALPRPIPGIPYNKEATKSLLGDIIPMVKYISRTQEVGSYWSMEAIKLQSPIIQLFSRPFRKPMVLISDFRESQGTCFPPASSVSLEHLSFLFTRHFRAVDPGTKLTLIFGT